MTNRLRLTQLNQAYAKFPKATGLRLEQERAYGKNAPKSLAEFNHIQYTDEKGWRLLVEDQRLFAKIDGTDTYAPAYKEKMKETYRSFMQEGFALREHALNRVLGQKSGPGKFHFSQEPFLSVLRRVGNCRQPDGKLVRFYDGIAAITAVNTGEIVSIVVRNAPRKDWERL